MTDEVIERKAKVEDEPYNARNKTFAIGILIEWDELNTYDWNKVYPSVYKQAFVFDFRNIFDGEDLSIIGFKVFNVGK